MNYNNNNNNDNCGHSHFVGGSNEDMCGRHDKKGGVLSVMKEGKRKWFKEISFLRNNENNAFHSDGVRDGVGLSERTINRQNRDDGRDGGGSIDRGDMHNNMYRRDSRDSYSSRDSSNVGRRHMNGNIGDETKFHGPPSTSTASDQRRKYEKGRRTFSLSGM